ncbi:MAG: hypothetical protein WAM82_15025 [Thermoanaerobaculia bacterium]
MTTPPIPNAARRFLTDRIGSAEQLDLLLFLRHNASRWWGAQALAGELKMPPVAVQSHLEHLSACNLLDVRLAGSVLYRYQPGREDLARMVEELALAHYSHRDAVLALLAGRQPGNARLFADAFQLRKDKRDDR